MPSLRREGMPRALIEALAQGVPAIVSRVGGMPELVRGGVEGLIVPPGQPAPLAAAIAHLRDDDALRQSMGRNARARIATDFSIERTVEQTIALYRALLP
jgi:glycosyltransferase involved in cell wall biosynthesis